MGSFPPGQGIYFSISLASPLYTSRAPPLSHSRRMLSDQEILFIYGKDAVISRRGRFTFVHLDRPSAELVLDRTENFDPDEFFKCDCRVCQLLKEGGVVIFDDSAYDDEEILLE
jgi:hypothetical protein